MRSLVCNNKRGYSDLFLAFTWLRTDDIRSESSEPGTSRTPFQIERFIHSLCVPQTTSSPITASNHLHIIVFVAGVTVL